MQEDLRECHKQTTVQDKQFNLFSHIFRIILDHHAPLKTLRIRGNQAKFMTKELRKSIMNRQRFKNRNLKWPSRENFLAYEKAKKLCNSLNKKVKKKMLRKMESWVVKRFGVQANFSFNQKASFIMITYQLNDNHIIDDESELVKTFNSYYIKIVTFKHINL